MSNPTDLPPVHKVHTIPATPEVTEAVEAAKKVQRVKTSLAKLGKNVGLPVLIGSVAAIVTTKVRCREDSRELESNDNDTNPDE